MQIKEKFGTLHFYASGGNESQWGTIRLAALIALSPEAPAPPDDPTERRPLTGCLSLFPPILPPLAAQPASVK